MGDFNQEKELLVNLSGCPSEIQARVLKIIGENSAKNKKGPGASALDTEEGPVSSPSKRSRTENGKKRNLSASPEGTLNSTNQHQQPDQHLNVTSNNGVGTKGAEMDDGDSWETAGAARKKVKRSNNGYKRPYGLLLKHDLSTDDLNNKNALITAVLKQKPDDVEIEEIKKTRKNDILIIGKSEKDFNSLCKLDKWKKGKHNFSPLLFFSENTARAIYFKDYDFNEDTAAIGDKLKEMQIAYDNLERVTVGNGQKETKTVRVLIHKESDIAKLEKDGILLNYRRYTPERHVKAEVTQCFNCGGFRHMAADCTNPTACLKCGGDHDHRRCTTPPENAKCRNCNECHPANFRGCKAWLKEHRNQRSKKSTSNLKSGPPASYVTQAPASNVTQGAVTKTPQAPLHSQRQRGLYQAQRQPSTPQVDAATASASLTFKLLVNIINLFVDSEAIASKKDAIMDIVIRSATEANGTINATNMVENAFKTISTLTNNSATVTTSTWTPTPQTNRRQRQRHVGVAPSFSLAVKEGLNAPQTPKTAPSAISAATQAAATAQHMPHQSGAAAPSAGLAQHASQQCSTTKQAAPTQQQSQLQQRLLPPVSLHQQSNQPTTSMQASSEAIAEWGKAPTPQPPTPLTASSSQPHQQHRRQSGPARIGVSNPTAPTASLTTYASNHDLQLMHPGANAMSAVRSAVEVMSQPDTMYFNANNQYHHNIPTSSFNDQALFPLPQHHQLLPQRPHNGI